VYKEPVTTISHKARAPWAFLKFDSPLVRWICVLAPGLLLYFVPLGELTPNQRHLLAIFAATILALVVRPAPMGVSPSSCGDRDCGYRDPSAQQGALGL
jgi:hypothetical protein